MQLFFIYKNTCLSRYITNYKLSGEIPHIVRPKGELDLVIVNLSAIEMQNTKKVPIIIGTVNKFSFMCVKLSYGNFLPNGIRHAIVNEVCDPTARTCSIQTSRTTGHK